MKYCSNCGKPLRQDVKICTNCGAPVNTSQDSQQNSHNHTHSQQPNQGYNNASMYQQYEPQPKKSKKKTILIIVIVAVVLAMLIAIFAILKHQFSPEKQADQIAHAVKKDDAKGLAKQVTSADNKLSEQEARAYLNYLKAEGDLTNVANQIESNTKEVEHGKCHSLSVNTDDDNVLNIEKDGKKYLFFNNYKFNIPQKKVYIEPTDTGDITYKFNGEKHHLSVDEAESKPMGTFPIGDYNLKASKKMEGKTFDGAINITMSEEDGIAKESFRQKRFNVTTEGGSMLDDINIYVNDKNEGDESDTFGPYDPDEDVIVYAQGTLEGETFKSSSVNVSSASEEDNGVSDVTVKFDEDAIDDYYDKKMESDDDDDDDDSDSDSEEVTRDNVIDKVESYEGHTLDTDEYTYKEPEKTDDGKWGFSFEDKDGNLAGSYTVDSDDGYVTEYDEDGEKVGSGY
ncbi:zinc-ribbon domain-containing protein [Staphylococcus pasteuri]|uniref:zinc ribbon domain-containing protein n=1 Tax=Staphylococcus TaxID=1279 RepID=UPI00048F537F|nr:MULTISPECIES: zinc-ribbon domain-containing protein [Staphylococcus]MBL3399032.1 zinc-ribbon domain-containing protein [Staphylococcus pasteuri]RNM19164.1 zinc-ribbon domain-containing protein [Staphylococcus pasteuri]